MVACSEDPSADVTHGTQFHLSFRVAVHADQCEGVASPALQDTRMLGAEGAGGYFSDGMVLGIALARPVEFT